MKVKYIEHSCFSIELENVILLFDYYKGQLPDFDKEKTIYVFSSHNHHDHFDISIFKLLEKYQKVKYIFSKDIKKKFGRKFFNTHGVDDSIYEKIEFIGIYQTLETADLKIETLNSTDEGVAFIVTVNGKTIYHAGDLHLWAWNHKTAENNAKNTEEYINEIERIKNRHFDVAFLVLDPRQEDKFHLGFDYFMRNTDTDKAYPMHFWNDDSIIDRLKSMNCSEPYRDKIMFTN
ncbi:MBL fold metallo-hydrolase [Clostridium chromiireducens]|uniref:MBL fold metallo-hydrolase n=1 Tax=Clostridium chromiireducens TaxID=225345 RepID=UPI003AF6754C